MVRPAVGSLELPCWTIICGSVGAVVGLTVVLLTAAGLSSDDRDIGLSLPVCPDKVGTTCTGLTSAEIIKHSNGTGPCTVTCPVKNMATYYINKCSDIRAGNFYARCMAALDNGGGAAPADTTAWLTSFNVPPHKTLVTPDGKYCDQQERIYADKFCYPVADAHNVKSDPDSTFDKATAWETMYHLKGSVDGNRCGYLTYRDIIKVHNCNDAAFGCQDTQPVNDPYLNFVAGTGMKKVMEGTSGIPASHYTTCIKTSEITCGDEKSGAPAGWTWSDTLPKISAVAPVKNYVYGDKRSACPGSAAESSCAPGSEQMFTCLMGVAPAKGGWRKIAGPTAAPTAAVTSAPTL